MGDCCKSGRRRSSTTRRRRATWRSSSGVPRSFPPSGSGDGVWVTVGGVALAAPARDRRQPGRASRTSWPCCGRSRSRSWIDDEQPAWEGAVAGRRFAGGHTVYQVRLESGDESWRSSAERLRRARGRDGRACDSPDSRSPRCAHDAFAAARRPRAAGPRRWWRSRCSRCCCGASSTRTRRSSSAASSADSATGAISRPARRPRRAVGDGGRVDRLGDRLAADRRAARVPALAHGVPRQANPERRGHAARGAAAARRRARVPLSLRRERRRHARRAARARARGRAVDTVGASGRDLRARLHDVRVRLPVRERGARAVRHDARRGGGGARRLAHARAATRHAAAAHAVAGRRRCCSSS